MRTGVLKDSSNLAAYVTPVATAALVTSSINDLLLGNGTQAEALDTGVIYILNKTSTLTPGPQVLFTQSGTGRWLASSVNIVVFSWHLNGDIGLATTDTTAVGALAANGGVGTFDGVLYVEEPTTIVSLRAMLRSPGTAGTVSAEFLRWRAGVFFSLGIVSLGLTPFGTTTVAVPGSPNNVLAVNDAVFVRLRTLQTGSPEDLTLQIRATL